MENFQTEFVFDGGWFLSYGNHKLIKLEEEKRFGLQKQFCNYEKWEINRFENFPCEFFPCKTSRCPCKTNDRKADKYMELNTGLNPFLKIVLNVFVCIKLIFSRTFFLSLSNLNIGGYNINKTRPQRPRIQF